MILKPLRLGLLLSLFLAVSYLVPLLYLVSGFDPVDAIRVAVSQPGALLGVEGHGFVEVSKVSGTYYVFVYGPPVGGIVGSLLLALLVSMAAVAVSLLMVLPVVFRPFARLLWSLATSLGLLSFPFVDALVVKRLLSVSYGLPGLFSSLGFVLVPRGFMLLFIYEFMVWLPVAVAVVGSYVLSTPRELIESALQLGARGWRLVTHIAGLARPAVLSSFTLVSVLVLDDVGGPYVFQDEPFARGLLAYRAYSYFVESTYGSFSLAGLGFAIILLLISALIFLAGLRWYAAVVAVPAPRVNGGSVSVAGYKPGYWPLLFLAPSVLLRLLAVCYGFSDSWQGSLPRCGLGGWSGFLGSPDLVRASLNSVMYTLFALLLLVPPAVYMAWHSARRLPGARLISMLALLPLGIPGIVLGYAYFLLGNSFDVLRSALYTSPGVFLVVGYAARRIPVFYAALRSVLEAVPLSVEEAGYMLGASVQHVIKTIVSPIAVGSALLPLVYVAVSVAGEVSLSLTVGGLAGSSGAHHPAPLMYVVAGYVGLSGVGYGNMAAAAMLFTYMLAGLAALAVWRLVLFIASPTAALSSFLGSLRLRGLFQRLPRGR